MKIIFIFSCSGMFRNVPACSGMFRVPGFIDGRINTYLANICICPHFGRQRKGNANLELQIYHIFAPFANISKSVFSSSV